MKKLADHKMFHFRLPVALAKAFHEEAKRDDRSLASLFRRILEERYKKNTIQ